MDRHKITRKIATYGLCSNVFLAIIKLAAGLLSNSRAMLADGFNSLGDVFSSVMTFAGNRISSTPKDSDHPYGHGKAEYVFSAIIGVSLLLVAWSTVKGSAESLTNPQPLTNIPLLVGTGVVTIVTKTLLYIQASRKGKTLKSPLIMATSEDHRADVFVTSGTLIGIAGHSMGYKWMDGAVGILISAWIGFAGIKVLLNAYNVLMDSSKQSAPLIQKAKEYILTLNGIEHIDMVNAKPVGTCFLIVVKVTVDGEMNVLTSHRITKNIKEYLLLDEDIADVIVHVNPLQEHAGESKL